MINTSSRENGVRSRREDAQTRDDQVAAWLGEYTRLRAGSGTRPNRTADDLKARIAEHYTGLVESIARRFTGSGEPLEDMVQEGFLGLLSALENYDPCKKVKFSTYATHFIAGAMRHCLRDRGKIIKEPAWLHEVSSKVTRATDALAMSLGRPPAPAEIAATLNLTEEAVEEILATRAVFQVASFEADPEEGATGLVDPEKIKSDKHVTGKLPIEDRIVLEGAVDKLKALEQKVLYEFFYKDLNQTEITRKFDISCNYVSHILKNSTKKLRRVLGEAEVRDRGRQSSIVDGVTGLYTAAHVQGRLEEEVSRASRGGYSFALIVVDMWDIPTDGRRREAVLAACGAAIRESIRRVDIAGRFTAKGSDESFLILLPHTGAQANIVAERLEGVLAQVAVKEGESFLAHIGLALFPEQGRTTRVLLDVARGKVEAALTMAVAL